LGQDPKVVKLTKDYDDTDLNIIELESRLRLIDISKSKKLKINNKIPKIKKIKDKRFSELLEIENKHLEQIYEIEKKLESKYDHLNKFYCRKKFLPQFLMMIINNLEAFPQPDDDTPMLLVSGEKGSEGFLMPEKYYDPKKGISDEDRKYYLSPAYHFRVIEDHKEIKWLGNEPSAGVKELRKMPPFNRFSPGILGVVPVTDA